VKEAALRLGVPVYQPERIKRPESVDYLRSLAPEAMVVVGLSAQIIPQSIIDITPLGILNVHASLLPEGTARRRPHPMGHRQRGNRQASPSCRGSMLASIPARCCSKPRPPWRRR